MATYNRKHGMHGTSTYSSWSSMIARCTRANADPNKIYFARGVEVCRRWFKFENFLIDMGERPSPFHSLDRKDNKLGYSNGNCRWATKKEQGRNRSTNRFITIDGITLTVTEWAERSGLKPNTVFRRLYVGWADEDAVKRAVS